MTAPVITRDREEDLALLAPTIDLDGHLATRLFSKVDTTGVCWQWTADLTNDGYGRFWYGGLVLRAHRAVWCLLIGPVPEHLVPDHRCKNRACVNPDHIEWITEEENNRRSGSISARNARATRCTHGHPFTETNTIWREQKGRMRRECLTCTRAQSRTRYLRRTGQA